MSQYYTVQHASPKHLHRFYSDSSTLTYGDMRPEGFYSKQATGQKVGPLGTEAGRTAGCSAVAFAASCRPGRPDCRVCGVLSRSSTASGSRPGCRPPLVAGLPDMTHILPYPGGHLSLLSLCPVPPGQTIHDLVMDLGYEDTSTEIYTVDSQVSGCLWLGMPKAPIAACQRAL